jgi:hypothetical protein
MDAAPPAAPAPPGPAPVVWLAPARGAADRHALDEWALARGVRIVLPADGRAPAIDVDPSVAERVEDELERARDAVAAQETDGAERALARAEAILRAHPELPNAAWLMAEVHRLWSSRWHRLEPRDPARGDAAWRRAAALDGGRVAGVGETPASPEAAVHPRFVIEGAAEGATVLLDGAPLVDRPAGEHVITVSAGGVVRYAAWLATADATELHVRVPGAPACSTGDLASAQRDADDGSLVRAAAVRCPSWLAVAPLGAALGVATCEGGTCGPLAEWRVGTLAPPPADVRPEAAPHRWPGWATGAIFATGIVVVTGITLAATGAFDKSRTETRFVNGGLKLSSF